MGYDYTPQPNYAVAAAKVKPPAIILLVMSSLGAVTQVGSMLTGLGRAMTLPADTPPELARMANLLNGPLGVINLFFGLAVCGFIIFGALKMMNLRSYPLAMAAAIVASIPCISPCCCAAMIPGIWSIVVLSNAEVKAAFR